MDSSYSKLLASLGGPITQLAGPMDMPTKLTGLLTALHFKRRRRRVAAAHHVGLLLLVLCGTLLSTVGGNSIRDQQAAGPATSSVADEPLQGHHRRPDMMAASERLMEQYNRAITDRAYYTLLTIYALFILFGTISNSLICLTVILKPKILSPRNIFIVNLAASDLLLCLFTMPFSFIEISTKLWHMGLIPCKLVAGLQASSIYVSTISITAIALDRYRVIVYPTHQETASNARSTILLLSSVWIGALLLSLPLFYFRTVQHFDLPHQYSFIKPIDVCVEDWPFSHGRGIYSVISMMFQYVMPITIVSVVYAKISDKLQKRLIRRQQLTQLECQQKRQLNLIRRTHTMLVSVSLIFGLSWLPLNLLNLIGDFSDLLKTNNQLFRVVFAICHLIGCSSACSNPILYGYLNENFRKECHQVYSHHLNRLVRFLQRLCLCAATTDSAPPTPTSSSSPGSKSGSSADSTTASSGTASPLSGSSLSRLSPHSQSYRRLLVAAIPADPPSISGCMLEVPEVGMVMTRAECDNKSGISSGRQTLGRTMRFCLCITSSNDTVATASRRGSHESVGAGRLNPHDVKGKKHRRRRSCRCQCHSISEEALAFRARTISVSNRPQPLAKQSNQIKLQMNRRKSSTDIGPGLKLADSQPTTGRHVWLRFLPTRREFIGEKILGPEPPSSPSRSIPGRLESLFTTNTDSEFIRKRRRNKNKWIPSKHCASCRGAAESRRLERRKLRLANSGKSERKAAEGGALGQTRPDKVLPDGERAKPNGVGSGGPSEGGQQIMDSTSTSRSPTRTKANTRAHEGSNNNVEQMSHSDNRVASQVRVELSSAGALIDAAQGEQNSTKTDMKPRSSVAVQLSPSKPKRPKCSCCQRAAPTNKASDDWSPANEAQSSVSSEGSSSYLCDNSHSLSASNSVSSCSYTSASSCHLNSSGNPANNSTGARNSLTDGNTAALTSITLGADSSLVAASRCQQQNNCSRSISVSAPSSSLSELICSASSSCISLEPDEKSKARKLSGSSHGGRQPADKDQLATINELQFAQWNGEAPARPAMSSRALTTANRHDNSSSRPLGQEGSPTGRCIVSPSATRDEGSN